MIFTQDTAKAWVRFLPVQAYPAVSRLLFRRGYWGTSVRALGIFDDWRSYAAPLIFEVNQVYVADGASNLVVDLLVLNREVTGVDSEQELSNVANR